MSEKDVERIVKFIWNDLGERKGFRNVKETVDIDVQIEIFREWTQAINKILKKTRRKSTGCAVEGQGLINIKDHEKKMEDYRKKIAHEMRVHCLERISEYTEALATLDNYFDGEE